MDDAIFLPEKSANNRRIQPLIPDDFGRQTLIFIDLLYNRVLPYGSRGICKSFFFSKIAII